MRTKAKINKQNTRHGKMDMPFAALNKYAGMAKGGDVKKEMKAAGIFAKAGEKKLAAHERREAMGKEKDTPAMAKKEMSVLKKAKAPKDVMDYEKAEHKAMGFARGGGIESKGKTRGKFFAGGGDIEGDTDAEGYGTKITRSPRTFAEAFKEARAKGKGTEFTWNGKKVAAYRAGEEPESWKKSKPAAKPVEYEIEKPRDTKYDKFVDAMAPGAKAKSFDVPKSEKKDVSDKASAAIRTGALQGEINRAQAKRERDMGSYGKDVSMYREGGSVKKFARGGGIESKGKTRGKFI